MTIPLAPFAGRMSYCLTRALHMVLAARGDHYAVPWLECVSGQAFGFVYAPGRIAGVGGPYHVAGLRLLKTLGYPARLSQG